MSIIITIPRDATHGACFVSRGLSLRQKRGLVAELCRVQPLIANLMGMAGRGVSFEGPFERMTSDNFTSVTQAVIGVFQAQAAYKQSHEEIEEEVANALLGADLDELKDESNRSWLEEEGERRGMEQVNKCRARLQEAKDFFSRAQSETEINFKIIK